MHATHLMTTVPRKHHCIERDRLPQVRPSVPESGGVTYVKSMRHPGWGSWTIPPLIICRIQRYNTPGIGSSVDVPNGQLIYCVHPHNLDLLRQVPEHHKSTSESIQANNSGNMTWLGILRNASDCISETIYATCNSNRMLQCQSWKDVHFGHIGQLWGIALSKR